MAKRKQEYGNESISMLEGADRVRKRPGVIFGSDGLEGCEHAVFEILSNAIDEAREGFGKEIVVTHYPGRLASRSRTSAGAARWTGTKKTANTTGSWSSASCTPAENTTTTAATTTSTPWVSTAWVPAPPSTPPAFMDVIVRRDGKRYDLHFEKGQLIGEMQKSPPPTGKRPAPPSRWQPDLEVFTQTSTSPTEYFNDVLHAPGRGERRHHLPLRDPGRARL